MMTKLKTAAAALAACFVLAVPAQAAVITLDFEDVNATYPSGFAFVDDFYDGGTSSDGTTGTDFGIQFSDNAQAICLNSTSVFCSNTSRGGIGNPNSQEGGLFFLSGAETFMNVAAGFDTGFSFFYTAISQLGSISVYDGLNGMGNLLATLNLATTPTGSCSAYNAGFCPFVASGIGFAGTALSVSFAGVANQIVFDDVTFGSVTPDPISPIPLPAGGLLLLTALGGAAALRRRKAV